MSVLLQRHDLNQCIVYRKMLLMPGLLNDETVAVKILTVLPGNSIHGRSTHSSSVLLLHEDTGLPAAVSIIVLL